MLWWFLFDALFFFPGLIACYPYTINEFNVGAFFNLNNYDGTMDLSGVQAKEAILMAIREINNKSDGLYDDLLPNITFKLATEHPNILFSTSTVAANAIRTSFNGDGIRGCIGPGTNAAIAGTATILREKGVFQIGYGGQDDAYAIKETFPSFVRVNPASGIHARVLAKLIYQYFKYERVAIIHSYNVYGYYVHLKFLQSIQLILGKDYETNTPLVFTDYGTKDYKNLILQVKQSGARIFVLLYSPVTWAIPMLKEGWKQGLFQDGTQIFTIEDMTTPHTWQLLSNSYRNKYQIFDTYTLHPEYINYELSNHEIASLMKGFIGLRVMINKKDLLTFSFIQRWKKQKNTNIGDRYNSTSEEMECNQITDDNGKYLHQIYDPITQKYQCRGINFTASVGDGSDILPAAFFAYDAVLLLARSLDYYLRNTSDTATSTPTSTSYTSSSPSSSYTSSSPLSSSSSSVPITSQNQITFYNLQEILNQFISIGVTGSYSQSQSYEMRSDNERKTDLSFSLFTFNSNYFLEQTIKENNLYEGKVLPSEKGLFYTGKLYSAADPISNLFTSCHQEEGAGGAGGDEKNLCDLQNYNIEIFNCSCSSFLYDTKTNSPPRDLPPLQTKNINYLQKIILIIFTIFFFLIILFTIFLLYFYRKCRYVKITQPELSIITFLGGICICIAALITSFDLQEGSCKMIEIFCHFGFIFIFSPLITKTWRLYMIIGYGNLKKIQITMKQTLLVVMIFISISILLVTLVEAHRPMGVDYEYEMIKDTPHERIRAKYCPAGRDVFMILLYVYEALVVIAGGVICYLTKNLPSGISDSSQVANAIFGIIAVTILGVSVTQLTKMHHQDTLFVTVLLALAGSIRALHVLYRSLTVKLLEGYDLDSQFQLVQVREPISFFALLSNTRRKISNPTVTPSESPKSYQRNNNNGPIPSHTPSSDAGGRGTYRSQIQSHGGRVSDERQQIIREIDILQNRLELLANRALYASRLQQLSEPPDDFRQSLQLTAGESQQLPRKLKNYNGSTVGLSSSHRMMVPVDQSGERQFHGTDSYYEDPPPLSYRSATDLPNPYVSSQILSNHPAGVTALSLPLQKISQQKSYGDIENISKKSVTDHDVKSSHLLGSSVNEHHQNNHGQGSNPAAAAVVTATPVIAVTATAPKKSGRYNPNHGQDWKTLEEKPGSEISDL